MRNDGDRQEPQSILFRAGQAGYPGPVMSCTPLLPLFALELIEHAERLWPYALAAAALAGGVRAERHRGLASPDETARPAAAGPQEGADAGACFPRLSGKVGGAGQHRKPQLLRTARDAPNREAVARDDEPVVSAVACHLALVRRVRM